MDADVVAHIELDVVHPDVGSRELISGNRLAAIGHVPVQLVCRVGSIKIPVSELLALKGGALLTLDKRADEFLELMLGDQVVAAGRLVVSGDNFGIQITAIAEMKP